MLRPYVRPHQGPERTCSLPLASNSNDSKQRSMRKSVKIITVLVAITFMSSALFFVFDPTLRMLSTARKLCQTYFIGDLDGDSSYWEEEFPADTDYPGEPRVLPGGENNIGFVVTLDSCPDADNSYKAGVDTQYDPGHALYDAAAVLKHSIETNLAKTGKYKATMHAIVHPNAITCLNPRNGDSYDRVKVLENLGYYVNIQASPLVDPLKMTGPVVQQYLDASIPLVHHYRTTSSRCRFNRRRALS